ncbi:hypothetical protein SAMN05216184_104260 [Georgenia satyanarayanai]|uniref:Uncharacterized protein n=1 Tax=Georgenia satyanarayanai TaxID=860221 RepID=A0A2Y9A884_9MICO|nr:hypothetical protein [Georgenia satyanarayanai]PYG00318.1 hypothetical protein A8987_104260 [Georgenia satyanarayanai]SSA40704.1 hypothetical protein SAMN05216184_104260 [Georgenia satyanarayanai]
MTTERPARPPLPLVLALLLVLVEVGALAALAVGMLVEVLGGATVSGAVTAVLALLFLGICALLVVAARALHQRRRWGRGPLVTWQLLVLATGISQSGVIPGGIVALLVLLPVAVTVGLLVPPSVAWADRTAPPRAVV